VKLFNKTYTSKQSPGSIHDEHIVLEKVKKLNPNICTAIHTVLGVEISQAHTMTSHSEAKYYPDNPRVILLVQ
jgi:hypothetical protein